MCIDVVIVLERVVDIATQVIEVLGKGDEPSFHFEDRCFFALGIFLVLTCASIFITLFFLEDQGGVSGIIEW